MTGRCRCGYFRADHETGTGRCPLCQCGAVPAAHVPLFMPPSPMRAARYEFIPHHCPGKPKTKDGGWPALRRGSFGTVEEQRYETRERWGPILFPVAEELVKQAITGPPLVAMRSPNGPAEMPSHQKRQALGLGKRAVAAGWRVLPLYSMGPDGTEGFVLKLAKNDMNALVTWDRKPGNVGKLSGWSADIAYAWRTGEMPRRVTLKDVEAIFG